ncbi:unnamed protein product [Adineta steineri]|uniref:CENP-V/GFA domain-containing protein n=1 Tax=Adineta steineri TaxID=433720 RepID=A0A819S781_9BILA|nr:unnamed protein product [Adineta steineri]CAF4054512.1 unnamed protein product [Adineta steineri]
MTSIGKCLCGQISVSIPKEALDGTGATAVCYCINCRRVTGSLGSLNVILPESAVQIIGVPKTYKDSDTDSGVTIERSFCGNCGSSIYGLSPNRPGMWVVRYGLFNEIPEPSMEIYCKDRPSWSKPADNAKQFDAMPTK